MTCTNISLILLCQYFLWKMSAFFGKDSTFTQSNSMGVVLEIFSYAFSFCMSLQTIHLESGFRIGHKSEKWNDVTTCWHNIIVNFWRYRVSIVKFSYWSKFYSNIATRNSEIGNTPLWVLLNIWRLRQF